MNAREATIQKEKEAKLMEDLYDNFFSKKKVKMLMTLYNQYAAADCVLLSGTTDGVKKNVFVEVKDRTNEKETSVAKHKNSMIERKKIEDLRTVHFKMNAPIMYLVVYDEAIVCWFINFDTYDAEFKWDKRMLQKKTYTDMGEELKDVTYLEYKDAAFIISRKNYELATITQLNKFIELRNLGYEYK